MVAINGFVCHPSPRTIGVRSFVVPGTEVKVHVRSDVAPLLLGFASDFHRTVEPLEQGMNWGYAFRSVRGSRSPSFHSAGIALDLNAPKHPLGVRDTFRPEQQLRIRRLARKYGLRWGGDYKKRADDMHVEVIVPLPRAHELVRELQSPPPVRPSPGAPVLRRKAAGPAVVVLQRHLTQKGFPTDADGSFGKETERLVQAFQSSRRLAATGVVDPATWAALRA